MARRARVPKRQQRLGNLVISLLAPYQASLAAARGGNYAFALVVTAITVAVLIIIVVALGRERHRIAFGRGPRATTRPPRDLAAE